MADVTEGEGVPCVYCTGTVVIDEVNEATDEEVAEGFAAVYCEGRCDSCGRRVDYDYDPVANPPLHGSRIGPGTNPQLQSEDQHGS